MNVNQAGRVRKVSIEGAHMSRFRNQISRTADCQITVGKKLKNRLNFSTVEIYAWPSQQVRGLDPRGYVFPMQLRPLPYRAQGLRQT